VRGSTARRRSPGRSWSWLVSRSRHRRQCQRDDARYKVGCPAANLWPLRITECCTPHRITDWVTLLSTNLECLRCRVAGDLGAWPQGEWGWPQCRSTPVGTGVFDSWPSSRPTPALTGQARLVFVMALPDIGTFDFDRTAPVLASPGTHQSLLSPNASGAGRITRLKRACVQKGNGQESPWRAPDSFFSGGLRILL